MTKKLNSDVMNTILDENFQQVLETSVSTFSTFSTVTKTTWGYYLLNVGWKERHDANHALIITPPENPKAMIAEILSFYQKHQVTPRINFFHPDPNHALKKLLSEQNFRTESDEAMHCEHFLTISYKKTKTIAFEPLDGCTLIFGKSIQPDSWTASDIKVIHGQDWASWIRVIPNETYFYFILYFEGEPAAVASAHPALDLKYVWIDDVFTRQEYRKRGLCTFLVSYVTNWGLQQKLNVCLSTSTDNALKIYCNIGFQPLVDCSSPHWVYNDTK